MLRAFSVAIYCKYYVYVTLNYRLALAANHRSFALYFISFPHVLFASGIQGLPLLTYNLVGGWQAPHDT
jgi:hypothetical protein